jgi:AraC-like DNA-binding protein
MTEFTVAAGVTLGLLNYAVRRGASERALLRRSSLDRRELDDPDARIGSDKYVGLTRAAQELTGDPALALHWAAEVNLSRMSVVGLLGEASETMLESLRQVKRYGQLVTDVGMSDERFATEMINGALWSVDRRPEPNAFPELTETTFGFMICGSRVATPSTWLQEVQVTHRAPPYAAEYQRVWGAPVTFGARWNALRIDPSFLATPVNVQPRYVFSILGKHADNMLETLQASKTTRGRVEAFLLPILHTGDGDMDLVAKHMAVSRRTLARRLEAEGVNFERVLDELRRKLATHYLEGSRASVGEIALLIGFSDAAAFSRAFKRWTGQSPRALRNRG